MISSVNPPLKHVGHVRKEQPFSADWHVRGSEMLPPPQVHAVCASAFFLSYCRACVEDGTSSNIMINLIF